MDKPASLSLYSQMVLIRQVEEQAAELYQQGKIGGFLHLYIGQEAVSTGLISARQPQDRVITAYRDHGVAINCGIPAKEVMAELLGKATGCSGGQRRLDAHGGCQQEFLGRACHRGGAPADCQRAGFGRSVSGTAMAVTICMFGDGATNIGYFHEALNLSKVWKLPVLWVCENNQYGMGTSVDRASAVSRFARRRMDMVCPRAAWMGWMCWQSARRPMMRSANPRRQRTVLLGSYDLPLPRALDGRSRTLPASRKKCTNGRKMIQSAFTGDTW